MAEGRKKVDIFKKKPKHSGAASSELMFDIPESKWPIVYSPIYNITFGGLEKMHPFDAGKWGRIYAFLLQSKMLTAECVVTPNKAKEDDLIQVHTPRYLATLKWSKAVAGITEIPFLAIIPNSVVQRKVLRPFRYQVGGTVLAVWLAMKRGWGINLGGGFHHCSGDQGGGFCAYADITLAIRMVRDRMSERIKKVMIVDLDAHQGNGHARDFMKDDSVYILDIYNRDIYPQDSLAKQGIDCRVELMPFTKDEEYLDKVEKNLDDSIAAFSPDLVLYNAGTDILEGDALGCLSITPAGVVRRDQIVFNRCRAEGIPVAMVTSGGYQRSTARVIADSILNLQSVGLIGPL